MSRHIVILGYIHEGGEWISVARFASEMRKVSHQDVTFSVIGFTRGHRPRLDFARSSYYIPYASAHKPLSFFKNLFQDFVNTRNALKKLFDVHKDVELIWVTDFLMLLAAVSLRMGKRPKVIFHFQGLRSALIQGWADINYRQIIIKTLERLAILAADVVVVPSPFAKSFVVSMVGPFSKLKSIHIVSNRVPLEFFRTYSPRELTKFRRSVKLDQASNIIIYVGRITKYKGLQNLIDAFIQFNRLSPGFMLVFAYPCSNAEDNVLKGLQQSIEKAGVARMVKMIPDLPKTDLVKLYQVADLLVLPSEFELAPLVVIEALASGTPCLATNVGDSRDIMRSVSPVLLLKNNSVHEIVRMLLYFFGLTEQKKRLIKHKSKALAQQYRSKNTESHFYQLIQSLEV